MKRDNLKFIVSIGGESKQQVIRP